MSLCFGIRYPWDLPADAILGKKKDSTPSESNIAYLSSMLNDDIGF
jgi:hypothetical protein